ncbi:S-layer homology domain-containing protein [Paenibacillus roseipurpureus]|uniref:S-layer homology domain-containing protein n=1 Tax=Paenibacillus roseopurpureus TaxID=2918901 RepID=A0AA96RP25_9BACL|nr:S-layer homology domain-containing protein [Paenibacillus sp. MBLB1832]WNR46222.1 S-layer homology domain-containing protein [Paenibacillus sp. MBLB1832]
MVMRKWLHTCLSLVILMSLISPTAAWASEASSPSTYSMVVSNKLPAKDETIEVIIVGHALVDVYAFEINVEYDPTRLTFIDAKTSVPGFSVPPILKDKQIQLAHTQVGKDKGLEGDQTLMKLRFKALQNGKAEVILRNVRVVDSKLVSTTKLTDMSTMLNILSTLSFDDMADFDWAIEAIEALAAKGIVNGTGDRTFSPGAAVTRADYLVLLMRALGLQGGGGEPFADVDNEAYYAQPIAAARELGIVQGDEGNQFHPKASITREDMMVLTHRALRATKYLQAASKVSELASFDDADTISDYAVESVAALVESGLIHGFADGIHPQETTNRAQAVVLIHNLLTYIQKGTR